MNRIQYLIFLGLMIVGGYQSTYAQDRPLIKKGNQKYEEQKYQEAVEFYKKALETNPNSVTGMFNLANAYYRQKQTDAARQLMDATAKKAKDSLQRAAAQYNLGNTFMDERKWEEAIEAYKHTLRNNPTDQEARYNLSYAKAMLKKDQQDGKDNKQQDKKDQQQDKKDQENQQSQGQDEKDQQQQQQQDKNDQNEQSEQQQRPEPMPSKLSEQQAEQILNALQQEEKNLQEKQMKGKATPVKIEKDW